MNISKFFVTRNILKYCVRNYEQYKSAPTVCPQYPPKYIVTLMDSTSGMGEALALLLKQNPIIAELRLYDDKDTFPIAMDLSDIDTSAKAISYYGEETLKEALQGSHLVINCGGHSPNPYESYEDLFERNADDVRRTAIYLTEFNPEAIFCIARPPVDSLVPMVYMEYYKAGVLSPEIKIIGAANYWAMRANNWIARYTSADPLHVTCPIICGASPETVIAVVSGSNPGRKISNAKYLSRIHDGMAYGEEKVLSIRINEGGGPVTFAPAVATYRLVNNILKGLRGDMNIYDCAFVRQIGHLRKYLPYMTSIVKLGRSGVYTTHMPTMVGSELYRLKYSHPILKTYIHLGESYVHGLPMDVSKLPCAEPCDITRTKTKKDLKEVLDVKIKNPDEYDRCGDPSRRKRLVGKCDEIC